MTYVFLVSVILIMIGELADKSQLLALALATRFRTWTVIAGVFVATFVVHFVTTGFGMAFGNLIPEGVLPWITGILFIFFGIWTLRGDTIDEEDETRGVKGKNYGAFLTVAISFFLAELGDKTQIMTATIAADPGGALLDVLKNFGPAVSGWLSSIGMNGPGDITTVQTFWSVTLGSTFGMVIADVIAIAVGALLGTRLPEKLLTRISGTIFILFGLATIISRVIGG